MLALLSSVGLACRGGASSADAAGSQPDGASSPFEDQVLAIAATYTSWGRVDDELRWAPFLCRQPLPGVARPSESNDPSTHGQKLYSVFAKHRSSYPNGPHTDQAVVKQSWKAELVTDADASADPHSFRRDANDDGGDHFFPFATQDGGVYRAAEPAGLFIMFKVDAATPGTDQGWVYATVRPDGRVTSAGRVAACMGCHETSATHERLFGVPTGAYDPQGP
jgi:hypothetical protein